VLRVLRPAPERAAPLCPYFGLCGGCQWQHMPYEQQLLWKRAAVVESLAAVSLGDTTVLPTLAAPEPYGYRNHGRFSLGRRYGEAGFTTYYSHRFMRVDRCPIMHPRIEAILAAAQRRVRGHQLAVRIGIKTGDLLINGLDEAGDLPFPSGQKALEEEIAGRRYRISAAAFFQVNTLQAERLVATVQAALALGRDETLLDLYCGVGTFGLALAPRVRRVVGVEESVAALKDARYNARDLDNVEFLVGRAEEVLAGLHEQVDAAIVDPPRSGCRPEALSALVRLAPRKLAYVSCDPASLARDLRVLVDGGFTLRSAQPLDMFPQTYHVETVALLTSGQ
jgi:23S rRNA (uracil1939-C5)-methyltransferase